MTTHNTPDKQGEALQSCKWCDKGDRPNFLDQDGTLASITGEDGILCHAHEEYWWPCLKFGVELHSSRASVAAVEGDAADVLKILAGRHHAEHHKQFPAESCPAWPCDILRAAASSPAPAEPPPIDTSAIEEVLAFPRTADADTYTVARAQLSSLKRSVAAAEPVQPTGEQEKGSK